MKLTKFFLLFLALLCSELHAQQAFNAGIAIGMTTSQISGDGLGGWDKFGITGGAYVNAPFNKKTDLELVCIILKKDHEPNATHLTSIPIHIDLIISKFPCSGPTRMVHSHFYQDSITDK